MYHELHRHTAFSLLDSTITIEDLVKTIQEKELKAAAVTDHGTLAGCFRLWQLCKKVGIKPILGCESYWVEDYDSVAATVPYNYGHVVLLAMNAIGWTNLKKLQEVAWEKGYFKKPRIQISDLCRRNAGLIALTACENGIIGHPYLRHDTTITSPAKGKATAIRLLKQMKKAFGDRLYAEVSLPDIDNYVKMNKFTIKMARRLKLPLVVTNDSHYLHKSDSMLHDMIICQKWHEKLNDENTHVYSTKQLWLKSCKELDKARRKWHPYISEELLKEMFANTVAIEKRIEAFDILPEGSPLPTISKRPNKELLGICKQHRLYKQLMAKKEYKARFDREYATVTKLGFAGYFLVVWDIVNYCRKNKIAYNARGSVNGSLVAFLMQITWVDPIQFNCPFERFLTEDRLTLPDIDMDFSAMGRERAVNYVKEKYGNECVAHISNYARWKPKGAIKDMGRVLGYSYDELNQLTKPIKDSDMSLAHSAGEEEFDQVWANLDKYPLITAFLEQNEDLSNYAQRVLGVPHQLGVHASGVVVTPTPVSDWCPVAYSVEKAGDAKRTVRITEWDMYCLEDAGILKLDLLGLNTLDIVQRCIELIGMHHKVKYHDFDTLFAYLLDHLDDEKVFESISKGETTALFQLGTSDGMVELARQIKPRSVEDIAIIIGLYRPATLNMGMHTEYINRRNGEFYSYDHPKMETVLGETLGIMIWQEEVSGMAVVLAGFKPSDADNFRKGIKQKDPSKIKPWKDKFVAGCKKYSDMDVTTAEGVWKFIEAFAGYGFNKNHAIAYALLAYMTAYLKYHYPLEYMASALSYSVGDDEKICKYLRECKRMGVEVRGPEINTSTDEFTIIDGELQYPLQALKKLGGKALEVILAERKKKRFKTFESFIERTQNRVVNIGVLINMVLGGCFRKFGKTGAMFDELMRLRGDGKTHRQLYCFACKRRFPISKTQRDVDENGVVCPHCGGIKVTVNDKGCERKKFHAAYIHQLVFGFAGGPSKLKEFVDVLAKAGANALSVIDDLAEGETSPYGFEVTNIKKHIDKTGGEMAFVDITDGSAESSITFFSRDWASLKEEITKGGCYLATLQKNRGQLLFSSRNGSISKLTKQQ